MEVKVVVTLWQIITVLISISGLFAVNTYMTKKNTKEVETLKDKDLVEWAAARKTFVSKELYDNQMEHIDKTLSEIKKQNEKILHFLTNK